MKKNADILRELVQGASTEERAAAKAINQRLADGEWDINDPVSRADFVLEWLQALGQTMRQTRLERKRRAREAHRQEQRQHFFALYHSQECT